MHTFVKTLLFLIISTSVFAEEDKFSLKGRIEIQKDRCLLVMNENMFSEKIAFRLPCEGFAHKVKYDVSFAIDSDKCETKILEKKILMPGDELPIYPQLAETYAVLKKCRAL